MFVSLLSVSEFVLSSELEMLGVAAGSIVYSSEEDGCPEPSRTMKGMTRKKTQTLRSAYERLEAQAQRLGAAGVVGVRVTHRQLEQHLWEYTAQGTAVKRCGTPPGNRPFTCTLSVQEYSALARAGYRPLGVAFGVHVYFQKFHERVRDKIHSNSVMKAGGQNAERSDYTRGIYVARKHAMTALEAEAVSVQAEGVLGITASIERRLEFDGRTSRGMLTKFTVAGTAVAAMEERLPVVSHVVSLKD